MRRHESALIRSRHGLFAWVAAALFLRLLVPTGYMIGAGGAGLGLVPCPAAVAAPVAMHHHGDRNPPARHADAPCPFASLSAPVLPPADPLPLAARARLYGPVSLPPRVDAASPGPASLLPPATGPPTVV